MLKIYGRNVCKEAIKANRKIFKAYVTQSFYDKEKYIISDLEKLNVKIEVVEKNKLDNLGLHQGIALDVEDYKIYSLDEVLNGNKQSFLILDGIVDPHNLGAIMRTSDATGIDGIIIPKNRSVSLNNTVAKVSTGAIEYVKIIEVNNINRCIDTLKEKGFWIYGTDMNKDLNYTSIDTNTSIAVVIGNEGEGMSRLVKEKCDYIISIPMLGHVNSLNASVSASIVLYEILRKNNFKG
ncbi:MAG: 23S rRNA (guanosine(2251)-2'-O)-methyltransferase RlmB [Acholeplasmatales bacterium]|nr:23S rRNA (guanosine(2251)-2'-O)-methyltransferase RlmB [Acholeplasmatales bacterium]